MKPVVLLALNYVREQRWAVILLVAWVLLGTVLSRVGEFGREDILFFVKQQAIYAVAVSAFLAASCIHTERRTRRILAVLSKGIERSQYLAGLLGGVLLVTAIYLAAMGILGSLMFHAAGMAVSYLWLLLALLLPACGLAATTALLFSTFTPPLLALALSAIALGVNAVLANLGVTCYFLPVYALLEGIMDYAGAPPGTSRWLPAMWAILQAIVLWLLASWIFGRRDIAVAVE